MAAQQGNTNTNISPSAANVGLNLNSTTSQIEPGELSFAMNAILENFDGNRVSYSNEPANELCVAPPEGYQVIGARNIIEDDLIVWWLANPETGDSEIGTVKDCKYTRTINAKCLEFDVDHPVLKSAYFKTNCSTFVFWVDGKNRTRYIDLLNLPFKETIDGCDVTVTDEIDCNKMNVQPNFSIPQIQIDSVVSGGDTKAGTYQFAVQYANALREPYTSFYSVTNPESLFDIFKVTQDFDYPVDKSIVLNISNLDITGLYDYINLAVIRTVNNIPTVELVGNYQITSDTLKVVYSGQALQSLNTDDIFQKFEIYDKADDLTVANDVLIQDQLTTHERISYQEIANQIKLKWQTWRLRGDKAYANPYNIVNFKGYMGNETYAFELCLLLTNGKQTDGFHIPGPKAHASDLVHVVNADTSGQDKAYWETYNTATLHGFSPQYNGSNTYEGPYQWGTFGYSESTDTYPCNEIYGSLKGEQIRHHKFPDRSLCPHFDDKGYIYPLGLRIDVQDIVDIIRNSSLTHEQKANIQGFKILRSNRANNKSIVAKGIINNVLKYTTTGSIESTQTGEASNTTDDLLDTTVELINAAIANINGLGIDALSDLNDAKDDLTSAKSEDVGTVTFTDYLESADSHLEHAEGYTVGSIALAYIRSAEQNISAITQISDSTVLGEETIASDDIFYFPNYLFNDVRGTDSLLDNIIYDDSAKSRFAFHSPDTHFYQPSIGDKLYLESAIWGTSSAHIKEVKNHSRYQFVNIQAYLLSLVGGLAVGFASSTIGVSTNVFNGTAAFTAYQAMLDIIFKITPHKNYSYQYNAVGNYISLIPIVPEGNKQRSIDIGYYLAPGVFNVGDDLIVNNFQRESSVYLKLDTPLPYTDEIAGVPVDSSKTVLPTDGTISSLISSYYASIKNSIANQYGQLYSYETIDTGYQKMIDVFSNTYGIDYVFGGDTFINKFAFKNKLPLFTDNRVAKKGVMPIDDSDISYNEIPNVGKPKYWFSTDVAEAHGVFNTIFGVKVHKFFQEDPTFFYDNGKIFLFAYGIPNFYCESEVNVDLRQAYNSQEGDFFPHVGNHIPDEWLQEYNVPINEDNTYFYNKTFSKQNKENYFSHLAPDWTDDECTKVYPYRAIFSETRTDSPNPSRRNNWLIFKPSSRFDFPQNYGKLVSLEAIYDSQVYARFENKTLLYNALQTIPTSTGEAYVGKSIFDQRTPPLDLADTDLGYAGTQHKFFLKTEHGAVSVDAKRGQVLLLSGREKEDLAGEKYKCQQFLSQNLSFYITKQFPEINIDNHFNGIGLHGVYDARFGRLILTKLDYECTDKDVVYRDGKFYRGNKEVDLNDTTHFKNKSFTFSFDFTNMRWISFHSYLQNYYIGNGDTFFSGTKDQMYTHLNEYTRFNKYNDEIASYILEYPKGFKYRDELLQSVQDYTKVLKYNDYQEFIEVDDVYFDEVVLFNNQQCSGIRKLSPKPRGSINQYLKFPIYNPDNINITFTKSNNFYQYNTFWSVVKDKNEPIWKSSKESPFKELNQDNMNYKKLSYQKAPLVAKDLKIRHILNSTDRYKLISQFMITESQEKY